MENELNIKIKNTNIREPIIDFEEKELDEFNELVENTDFIFRKFDSNKYLYYKNIFINNIPKHRKDIEDDLTKLIKFKMNEIYKDFTDITKFANTINLIEYKENNLKKIPKIV